MTTQTLGEKTIRTEFNPSGSGNVNFIKQHCAKLIDVIENIRCVEGKEVELARLQGIAITAVEQAAMWAVKAATV